VNILQPYCEQAKFSHRRRLFQTTPYDRFLLFPSNSWASCCTSPLL